MISPSSRGGHQPSHPHPGGLEAVGDLVDLPHQHRGRARVAAAGLADLRPGPAGVDGDGDEALVGLVEPSTAASSCS